MSKSISQALLAWHQDIERDLPWKETKDPFYIWLSEIILQQTRVDQGRPYFLKFRDRFKNVGELAACSDEELMKLWQGLGYYSRARNLHKAAKLINDSGGKFPDNYDDILTLPGVGPYTAAAIASFAYDLPTPVIDGNVNRVISRLFSITNGIDTKEGKGLIKAGTEQIFTPEKAAAFNQAIMDFGALVCTPKNPSCHTCPLKDECLAFKNDMVQELPIKVKKIKKKLRIIHYALISYKDQVLVKKRLEQDIWKHLHDLVEVTKDGVESTATLAYKREKSIRTDGPYKHVLTHRNLEIYFHVIDAQELKIKNGSPYFLVDRKNLQKFAFPKIIDWYLAEKSIYLKEKEA